MYMGYGLDMGPYRGRGRGPMPMHPAAAAAAAAAAGRYPQAPYGYWPQYGYQFPPPFPPFPNRMPVNGGRTGGRGFIGERRPPPGTPGVSSGLQVSKPTELPSANNFQFELPEPILDAIFATMVLSVLAFCMTSATTKHSVLKLLYDIIDHLM